MIVEETLLSATQSRNSGKSAWNGLCELYAELYIIMHTARHLNTCTHMLAIMP